MCRCRAARCPIAPRLPSQYCKADCYVRRRGVPAVHEGCHLQEERPVLAVARISAAAIVFALTISAVLDTHIGIGAVNSADADAVRLFAPWGPQRRHGHRVCRGRRRRDGGVHEPRWSRPSRSPRGRRGVAIQAPRLALFERRQSQRQHDRPWTRHGSGADLRNRHRRPARREFPLDLLAPGGESDAHRISSSGRHDRQRILQPGRVSTCDVFRRGHQRARDSRWRYSQRRCPQLWRRDRLSGLRPPLCRWRRLRLDARFGCELRAIRGQWRIRRPRRPNADLCDCRTGWR